MQEEKHHNPFMQFIGKSEFFKPIRGVIHRDLADDNSSPRVSGGIYQSTNESKISRKEFELRKSLSILKDFGPELDRYRAN